MDHYTGYLGAVARLERSERRDVSLPGFRLRLNRGLPKRGSPLLSDSELTNFEGRYEWYFASDQRLTVAGFYKNIDRPIESFVSGSDLSTSFANAPNKVSMPLRAMIWPVKPKTSPSCGVFGSRVIGGIGDPAPGA